MPLVRFSVGTLECRIDVCDSTRPGALWALIICANSFQPAAAAATVPLAAALLQAGTPPSVLPSLGSLLMQFAGRYPGIQPLCCITCSLSAASHGDGQLEDGRQDVAVAPLHTPVPVGCRVGGGWVAGGGGYTSVRAGMAASFLGPPNHQIHMFHAEKTRKKPGADLSKWKTPWPVPTRLSSHT